MKRRNYRSGMLQLEKRAYRRKDGGLTERGPYWYFHFREGGRQRTLYIGESGNPETVVDEKLGEEPTKGEHDGLRWRPRPSTTMHSTSSRLPRGSSTTTRRSTSISRRNGVYFGAPNPNNLVRGASIK